MENEKRRLFNGQLFMGFALFLIGALALMDNFDMIDIGPIWRYWPILFVLMGLNKLLNARNSRERGDGIWWMFFGVWLFISMAPIFELSFHETWPMLLIGWGVSMLWKSRQVHHKYRYVKENSHVG